MSTPFTIEDLKQSKAAHLNENLFLNPKAKRRKYNSLIVKFDGKTFRSMKELKVYGQLRMRLRAGEISDLRCQVPYSLNEGGKFSCKYYADFVWIENGKEVVCDAKGFRNKIYLKKKALMLKVHGVEILEV